MNKNDKTQKQKRKQKIAAGTKGPVGRELQRTVLKYLGLGQIEIKNIIRLSVS